MNLRAWQSLFAGVGLSLLAFDGAAVAADVITIPLKARHIQPVFAAELNQKQWALRSGHFLMQSVSNANSFDTRIFQRGTYALELETRWSLFSQPGRLRTIA